MIIDTNVYFRRPSDMTIYAVLSPSRFRSLRSAHKLNGWLQARRDSGEIIEKAPR